MRVYQIGTVIILVLAVVFGYQNCAEKSFQSAGGSGSLSEEISNLTKLIHGLNGDLSCTQDSDCEVLGLGSRPCGGPEGFLVVSTANENYDEIVSLTEELEQKARDQNIRNNVAGTCEAYVHEEVHCVANTCQ